MRATLSRNQPKPVKREFCQVRKRSSRAVQGWWHWGKSLRRLVTKRKKSNQKTQGSNQKGYSPLKAEQRKIAFYSKMRQGKRKWREANKKANQQLRLYIERSQKRSKNGSGWNGWKNRWERGGQLFLWRTTSCYCFFVVVVSALDMND